MKSFSLIVTILAILLIDLLERASCRQISRTHVDMATPQPNQVNTNPETDIAIKKEEHNHTLKNEEKEKLGK